MNIYGGLGLGVLSPVSKVSAEPASSSGMSGVAYSSGSTEKKASDSSSSGGTSIALPGFSSDGTPHWEEHELPNKEPDTTNNVDPVPEAPQEKQLDVGKLLDYHNEGYKLYDDGEGGLTVDPNSKNNVYDPTKLQSTSGQNAHEAEKKAAQNATKTGSAYTMSGDDYVLDESYFASAQNNTGDNKVAESIAGGGGTVGKDQSADNHNDGYFGGLSNRATPGYTLW